MWQLTLDVETNGLVLFDLAIIQRHFAAGLPEGTDLLSRFRDDALGDVVLKRGLFLPILAIDDATYDILVRLDDEPSSLEPAHVLCRNGVYALEIDYSLIIADLEAVMFWDEGTWGNRLQFPRGKYAVEVVGFSSPDLSSAGYEFHLRRVRDLPEVTGSTGASMRVLRQP